MVSHRRAPLWRPPPPKKVDALSANHLKIEGIRSTQTTQSLVFGTARGREAGFITPHGLWLALRPAPEEPPEEAAKSSRPKKQLKARNAGRCTPDLPPEPNLFIAPQPDLNAIDRAQLERERERREASEATEEAARLAAERAARLATEEAAKMAAEEAARLAALRATEEETRRRAAEAEAEAARKAAEERARRETMERANERARLEATEQARLQSIREEQERARRAAEAEAEAAAAATAAEEEERRRREAEMMVEALARRGASGAPPSRCRRQPPPQSRVEILFRDSGAYEPARNSTAPSLTKQTLRSMLLPRQLHFVVHVKEMAAHVSEAMRRPRALCATLGKHLQTVDVRMEAHSAVIARATLDPELVRGAGLGAVLAMLSASAAADLPPTAIATDCY